jgi:superfamily II DNA or RNA helicase
MHHALIYVDNTEMLENVQRMLEGQNISSSKFTGGEDIDRRSEIIDSLRDRNIDAIVAMKCLDEGVDIPSA